jgi:hypothetical protein
VGRQERGFTSFIAIGRMLLGRVQALSGGIAEAIDLLERAQPEYGARKIWSPAVEGRVYLGGDLSARPRSEDARAIGREALQLARARGLRGVEAYALRLLAALAADAGRRSRCPSPL